LGVAADMSSAHARASILTRQIWVSATAVRWGASWEVAEQLLELVGAHRLGAEASPDRYEARVRRQNDCAVLSLL
jgi:hypothetical protein